MSLIKLISFLFQEPKKKKKGLKLAAAGAAGAAAVGLTAFGISQLIKGGDSDSD
jgi:hypothetical protein